MALPGWECRDPASAAAHYRPAGIQLRDVAVPGPSGPDRRSLLAGDGIRLVDTVHCLRQSFFIIAIPPAAPLAGSRNFRSSYIGIILEFAGFVV